MRRQDILDDPISSFDQNKKFAILDMLFIRGGSFRGKTALLLTHDFEPVIDAVYNHPSFFEGGPVAHFLENNSGVLSERIIQKDNILSSVMVARQNISESDHTISKLIYLRRLTEIVNGKTIVWHLLSNLFHKRTIPMIGSNEREMTPEEIELASEQIKQYVPDFEYNHQLAQVCNRKEMIRLY